MPLKVNSMVNHFVVVVISEEVVMAKVVIYLNPKVTMVSEVFVEVVDVDVDVVCVVVRDNNKDQRVKSLFLHQRSNSVLMSKFSFLVLITIKKRIIMINNKVIIVKIIIHDVIPSAVNVVDETMMKVLVPNNQMMGKQF
jgi:hypothetical protein